MQLKTDRNLYKQAGGGIMGNQAIKPVLETSFPVAASIIIPGDGPHNIDIENGIESVKFLNEEDGSGNSGLNGSD